MIAQVKINKSNNNHKYVTIPKKENINVDDYVRITKIKDDKEE